MATFHFHIQEQGRLIVDEEGSELPDLAAARHEALNTAREMLIEALRFGVEEVPDALLIGDRTGQPIERVPLSSVLPKALKG
jgi:hypothetical protein